MAVETDTIIQKMMKELTQAQQKNNDNAVVQKHIANVQLLCELILEEKPKSNSSEISTEEMKAMIGHSNNGRKESTTHREIEDSDDANGSSIFDF
ncbi:YwdI family protein [Virgibacillus litoralis]|uniref:YwdI family protein n=1 Tax=Virgibacillus litoralis TaxID=578221 RepID=A0ABS4HDB6_9BACI|nr:YwdI family protein [Virgibacillus litoralis]MBP1948905.1 hypothetical protein [Virgibacillus litoralis]